MKIPETPSIKDRTFPPPGVLPRHIQLWLIIGIALSMMAVIAFSGSRAPETPKKDKTVVPITQPDRARIDQYRQRLEDLAQRLAVERAELEKAKGELKESSLSPPSVSRPERPTAAPETRRHDVQRRTADPLFASNVALTYREEPRRSQSGASQNAEPSAAAEKESAPKAPPNEGREQPNLADGPEYRLFEGTVIETVLTNRLDGEYSGPVNCMVTTDVYSHNRRHVVIPQGSRILGEAKRVETFGQQRLAVMFHRLIMPDGYAVNLEQFRGLNQIGETGLRDRINHHYGRLFGVSLAIGTLGGLTQANSRYGLNASGADVYRQGVTSSVSDSALRILDRYLNVLPTLTIREGHRVKVYLSNDLSLPAYDNHRMPEDL